MPYQAAIERARRRAVYDQECIVIQLRAEVKNSAGTWTYKGRLLRGAQQELNAAERKLDQMKRDLDEYIKLKSND